MNMADPFDSKSLTLCYSALFILKMHLLLAVTLTRATFTKMNELSSRTNILSGLL